MIDKEQQYQNLFDAWQNGKMTSSELAAFEQRRKDDPDFDMNCTLFINLSNVLQAEKYQHFGKMIHQIEQNLEQQHFFEPQAPKLTQWIRFRPLLAYAASLTAIIAAISLWLYFNQNARTEACKNLAQQKIIEVAMPQHLAISQGAMGNNQDSFLFEMAAKGRFSEAALFWQKQYELTPNVASVRLNLAVCRLKNNETKVSSLILQQLYEDIRMEKIGIPREQVTEIKWYLSLAYAREGQLNKSKKLLREISPEYEGSAQFLSKLEQL